MDEAAFWDLIGKARINSNNDNERISTYLESELLKKSESDILSFAKIMNQKLAAANTHDLWAAAKIMNTGCSVDDFEYFRGWLISQGRAAFENAVKNPETLADIAAPQEEPFEFESMLYVALYVHEVKTGKEVPDSVYVDNSIKGTEVKMDAMSAKFPRLMKKFNPLS